MDLSPNFASTLMGISTFISSSLGIFAPNILNVTVNDTDNWKLLFFISAGIYFICNLIFIIFGKAKIQIWNNKNNDIK